MFCLTISFAQQSSVKSSQPSVDIIPIPVNPLELDESRKDYNPSGIKLYYDADRNFVNLRFERTVSNLQIEFLDKKGRALGKYNDDKITHIKINLARLDRGKYYVRVNSREIEDFLQVNKEQ